MRALKLKPAPDISWIIEYRGMTLVRHGIGAFVSIPYPHAGLWAMLAAGTYSAEWARDMMALLMSTDTKDAEREVIRTVTHWTELGLLVME